MNNMRGMSLAQMKEVLAEMRSVYKYDDERTYIGELRDLNCNSQRRVEIMTVDEKTDVTVVMSKRVKLEDGRDLGA